MTGLDATAARPVGVPAPVAEPAAAEHEATNKHLRGSSLLLAGRFLSLGINLAVQVLIVRALSKSDYGAFAYVLSLVSLGSSCTVFGLDKAVSRFVPIYDEERDYGRMLGTIVLMVGTIVALNAALVLLVYGLRGVLAQRYVQQPEAMALLLILILLVPVQALDSFMISLLTVFSGARSVFFRKYLLGPILLLSVVLVTLIGGLSVKFLAAGYLLGGLIGIIIYTTVLVRLIADRGLLSRRSLRALRFPAREVFGFTTPLLISDVIFVLRGAFVVVLLEHFGTLSDVASFRAVFPVARLNLLVFQSFAFLFTPATARLFARDDLSHINSLYWRTAVWIAVLSFPVFALSFCAAQPLTVLLFGQGYAQSALLLSIMAFGFYVSAAMGFSGLTLRVYGKVRALFLVDFVGAALSLCASLLLIPRYGALGGAISTGGTLALQTVLYQVALRTETGIHAFEREYLKAYLTLASGAAGLLLFQWLVSPGMLLSLLAAAGASAVVLRLNRRLLGVADTFPELLRMPLARRFFAG